MNVPPHAMMLDTLLRERILLLDGAMGTMIQRARLAEEDYRGERFRDWARELRGNNDLLSLTQPRLVRDIHLQYLAGGRRHHRDQYLQLDFRVAGRLRHGVARARTEPQRRAAGQGCRGGVAWRSVRASRASSPACSGRPTRRPRSRPTSTTRDSARSASTSWWRPTPRRSRGSLEGGVDLLLVETVFDTLNAKAALFAHRRTPSTRAGCGCR